MQTKDPFFSGIVSGVLTVFILTAVYISFVNLRDFESALAHKWLFDSSKYQSLNMKERTVQASVPNTRYEVAMFRTQ